MFTTTSAALAPAISEHPNRAAKNVFRIMLFTSPSNCFDASVAQKMTDLYLL